MIVTFSPAGKDVYFYLTADDPGESARSLPDIPARMLFDSEHQWIGFELIELMHDGSTLDLGPAIDLARREAPELAIAHDPSRRVVGFRWQPGEPASVLPWDAILDFDAAGQLVGIEFMFGGALEIDGRLARLPHQRI